MRFSHSLARGVLALALPLVLAAPAAAVLEENLTGLTGDQTEGYLGPFASGLSGMLNSGIFRSGHVPATGFSMTFDARASYISFGDDDREYTASTPGYEDIEAPTVVGNTQSVTAQHQTISGLEFTYPGGFDMDNFGIAVPQLTIGNVAGTRAIVRWIAVDLGDEDLGDFEFIGVGGQHSVSQYFPGMPFDLAVGGMWQNFKIGEKVIDATALQFMATASRRYGQAVTFEPYLGLGVDSFNMEAEYDVDDDETIEVSFDRQNDLHVALGASLNLPVVKLTGEYNIAAVNGFAGGISFGF
jgi:hypothetical protein